MDYTTILLVIMVIVISKYMYSNYQKHSESIQSHQHYKLVSEYLLNGKKTRGPMIWIHLPSEINARNWESFYSRTSTDVNQPYLHLTLKSIVDKCENTCTIGIINDSSFENLLPEWKVQLDHYASPEKDHYRQIGLCKILHHYGGMLIPSSFLCVKDLKPMYEYYVGTGMFIGETVNRTKEGSGYMPDVRFMGCKRHDPTMEKLILLLEGMKTDYTGERCIQGKVQDWCIGHVPNHIDGSYLGIKSMEGDPIGMSDLLESSFVPLRKDMWGIVIPAKDILESKKYAWFARMSTQQILRADLCISRYLLASY